MKKTLIFLILSLFVVSCITMTESEPMTVGGRIVYRHHEDKKTEYGYHYGYSMMKGKYCYHYGSHEVDEENTVKFTFLGDTLTRDSEFLFKKSSDSVEITYVKVFRTRKNKEPEFDHNDIREIK